MLNIEKQPHRKQSSLEAKGKLVYQNRQFPIFFYFVPINPSRNGKPKSMLNPVHSVQKIKRILM